MEDSLREQLEEVRNAPLLGREDAERAAQAARLLGELAEVEAAARELFERKATGLSANEASEGDLAGLPQHAAVARILETAGKPMHIRDIAPELYRRGWRHPRPPYRDRPNIGFHLAAMLSQYREKFRRVAPNTFALVEWGEKTTDLDRSRPRLPLIASAGSAPDGRPWSEWIGDHPGAPVDDQIAAWRSS
jgi:hypothetical protein